MSDQAALEAFLDKWRTRWPEWRIAEVFVPAPERAATLAWLALRQELADAAWGGEDPTPGAAKLAWWNEELHGWALGRRRHPLGLALQRIPAPWAAVADAVPSLAAARGMSLADADGLGNLHAALAPFVAAAAAVSAAVAVGDGERDAASAAGAANTESAALALGLSAVRILVGAGAPATATATAKALLAAWPARPRGTRPDRIFAALARRRLLARATATAENDRNPAPSSWHTLWAAWRAGRSFPRA